MRFCCSCERGEGLLTSGACMISHLGDRDVDIAIGTFDGGKERRYSRRY